MCVITRKTDNIVVSISLIPGILEDGVLSIYNVYFPVIGELPNVGDVWEGPKEFKF